MGGAKIRFGPLLWGLGACGVCEFKNSKMEMEMGQGRDYIGGGFRGRSPKAVLARFGGKFDRSIHYIT